MPCPRRRQRGAVAIELVALFAVFFATFYAIVAYSIPMLLTLTFRQVSADAARAAIKVDPAATDYSLAVSREVTRVVDASWLPAGWRSGDCPAPDASWTPLPSAGEGGAVYGHFRIDDSQPENPRFLLHVCLQRKYNRSGEAHEVAIIPPLDLLLFSIPSLPGDGENTVLRGQSVIRL